MSEPYVIKMPQLSDTMTEGVVVSWEKPLGAKISRGDIVAQVETDKAIMDVEVFREGYLSGPQATVDSVIKVGDAIAYIVATEAEVNFGEQEKPSQPIVETPSVPVEKVDQQPIGVSHVIKMPQLSDTMIEGVVVSWEKELGDEIARGDIVAQVETDKAIMEVEVFRNGFLSGPMAAVGSVVPVGDAMAYLVADKSNVIDVEEKIEASTADSSLTTSAVPSSTGKANSPVIPVVTDGFPASRPDNKYATPLARRLAGSLHVNLNNIKGTGIDGIITADDVRHAQPVERPSEIVNAIPAHNMPEIQVPGQGRDMNAMEKAVSHSMTASLTMPTFRVMVKANPEKLIKASKSKGVSLTVSLAKVCAQAMQQHPNINNAYQPVDKIVERKQVDIGMAVAAEGGGLVVPVLRHCESRPIEELAETWKDLVDRGRKRRLAPEEYSNPTFMISNMGMLGVSYFDAIPTPGTAAILAISSTDPDGMPLTITADHRVINGAEVAMYLATLKELIEHPETWLGSPGPAIPKGDWDYDVVVIGGGPGGEDCARDLVEHGLKVAMVNDAPFPGGECLWRGCIPSKAWRAAADLIRDRKYDEHLGVEGTNQAKLNWAQLEQSRKHVLQARGEMALKTDSGMKIKVIHGFARFETDHRIYVDQSNNSSDPFLRQEPGDGSKGEHITFGCAVIATGAPPFIPPVPGVEKSLEDGGILTSDTVWNLESQPSKIAIIGAGAIGVEMAQIFQDFGSEVILVEAQDRILAEVEEEIAKKLTEILAKDPRISVHVASKLKSVKGKAGSMKLELEEANGEHQVLDAEYVLFATGKRPVLDPLNLQKANVETDGPIIKATSQCRTNVPHIFAVGDVIGGLMLAHTAGQQGRVAAANILGETEKYEEEKDCGVIFTRPQAAFVGLSVKQAKEKGLDAVEVKMPMSIDAKAMITGKTQGMIKIVANKSNHKIVGVHFLADASDTLIGEAVMMVSGEMTLQQVAKAIHPHPTQTELFGEMARRLLSRLRRSQKVKTKN